MNLPSTSHRQLELADAPRPVHAAAPGATAVAGRDVRSPDDSSGVTGDARMSQSLWYKDAIIYELHVRAFPDSDGDGIGDFRGLTQKLDYLQDLGVTAIWLLPFYPSPLRDDGYDIADYTSIHPQYGTLDDFQRVSGRGARARTAGHHRAGHQSHVRPASLVSAGPPRAAGQSPSGISTSGATRPRNTATPGSSFKDFEPSNWTWDPCRQGLLLAPLLFASARSELRQSGGPGGDSSAARFLVGDGRRWAAARCGALSLRARRDELREPAGDARLSASDLRRHVDEQLSRTACCWPKRISGRRMPWPISATATNATWRSTFR